MLISQHPELNHSDLKCKIKHPRLSVSRYDTWHRPMSSAHTHRVVIRLLSDSNHTQRVRSNSIKFIHAVSLLASQRAAVQFALFLFFYPCSILECHKCWGRDNEQEGSAVSLSLPVPNRLVLIAYDLSPNTCGPAVGKRWWAAKQCHGIFLGLSFLFFFFFFRACQ